MKSYNLKRSIACTGAIGQKVVSFAGASETAFPIFDHREMGSGLAGSGDFSFAHCPVVLCIGGNRNQMSN